MVRPERTVVVCIAQPFLEVTPDLPDRLAILGLTVRLSPSYADRTEDEIVRVLKSATVAVVSTEPMPRGVIERLDGLRLIVNHGTGVDNIDLDAATRRGVLVANLPGLNAHSVAELTLGLIIALARRLPEATSLVREGRWEYVLGTELHGKTLGVIGTGAIGRRVLEKASALGLRLVAHDVVVDTSLESAWGVRLVSLDELLAMSDIVTIHVPLTEKTRGLIGARELDRMKQGAFLVNVARGGIVDEEALYEHLSSRHLAGAALDVLEKEPPGANPLLSLPNVLVTPHIGGSTVEVARSLADACVATIRTFLAGEIPKTCLNPHAGGTGNE